MLDHHITESHNTDPQRFFQSSFTILIGSKCECALTREPLVKRKQGGIISPPFETITGAITVAGSLVVIAIM